MYGLRGFQSSIILNYYYPYGIFGIFLLIYFLITSKYPHTLHSYFCYFLINSRYIFDVRIRFVETI